MFAHSKGGGGGGGVGVRRPRFFTIWTPSGRGHIVKFLVMTMAKSRFSEVKMVKLKLTTLFDQKMPILTIDHSRT